MIICWVKAGFHQRRSHNQKGTSRQHNTDSSYDSVTYNHVTTALNESQLEAEYTDSNAQFWELQLVGSSATTSDNLAFTGS